MINSKVNLLCFKIYGGCSVKGKNNTRISSSENFINVSLKSYDKNVKRRGIYLCMHFEMSFAFMNGKLISMCYWIYCSLNFIVVCEWLIHLAFLYCELLLSTSAISKTKVQNQKRQWAYLTSILCLVSSYIEPTIRKKKSINVFVAFHIFIITFLMKHSRTFWYFNFIFIHRTQNCPASLDALYTVVILFLTWKYFALHLFSLKWY